MQKCKTIDEVWLQPALPGIRGSNMQQKWLFMLEDKVIWKRENSQEFTYLSASLYKSAKAKKAENAL